jgi:integrase/recombinase XerD
MLRKDVLSPEEIQKLAACHYDNENPNVRRAFVFCLYCGLRFCDVQDPLTRMWITLIGY